MKIKFINSRNGLSFSDKPHGLLEQMVKSTMTRFLVAEMENEIVIALYPYNLYKQEHKDLWLQLAEKVPDAKIVGAGYHYPHGEVEFDSDTCKEVFGFDRPDDVNLQERILESIKVFSENN